MKSIRISKSGRPSFKFTKDALVENNTNPWLMYRTELKDALKNKKTTVRVYVKSLIMGLSSPYVFSIFQGTTQRGKKFIQIGCKRFVGDNRRALIQWAKSGK